LLFCCFTLSLAQTKIEIKADTNYAFIGDVIHLDLYVESNQKLIWPALEDLVEPLEIQNLGKLDSSKVGSAFIYRQELALQSFDTGRFSMPSLAFASLQGDTFYSDTIALAFLGLTLDTTNAIFDIKEPLDVPFNFAEAKPYILITLALLLLIVLIVFLVKKYWKKPTDVEQEIIITPCEVEANDALNALQAKAYLSKGLVKTHYIELTEIVRRYFDREFEIDTLESTTDETLDLLKQVHVTPILLKQISELLREADLVKFAKSTPDNSTSTYLMSLSFTIVSNCHQMKMEDSDV
jgi:hypothetical protein